MIYFDKGEGNTEHSIEFFRSWLKNNPMFKPQWACIGQNEGIYNFRIQGDLAIPVSVAPGVIVDDPDALKPTYEPVTVALSGCSCGYGGEGPHGTLAVLNYLMDKNFDHRRTGPGHYLNEDPELRNAVFTHHHIHVSLEELPKFSFEVVEDSV